MSKYFRPTFKKMVGLESTKTMSILEKLTGKRHRHYHKLPSRSDDEKLMKTSRNLERGSNCRN